MEDLQKEFIPYDRALRLKALGFDKPCLGVFELIVVGNTTPKFRYNWESEDKWFNHNKDKSEYKDHDWYWSAPTFSQAFRWFRKKYGLYSWVQLHNGYIGDSYYKKLPITWTIMEHESGKQYYERDIDHNYLYHTHEEAELACLDKLIEIVELTKPTSNQG